MSRPGLALGLPVATTAEDALQAELNHTQGHIEWYRAYLRNLVAECGPEALATPHGALVERVYLEERQHLVKVCRTMLAADVQGRIVAVAKDTGAQFGMVLTRVLDALDLTREQQAMIPEVVPNVMRLIASEDAPDG